MFNFMSIKYSHRPCKFGIYSKEAQSSLGPQNTRIIQYGPHIICYYTITEGKRIHWGIGLCLEPREHLMDDWGWPDGKWMKGLLVPRQGHMESRKCEKNRTFVSFGIWGVWCKELCEFQQGESGGGEGAGRPQIYGGTEKKIENPKDKDKNPSNWFISHASN